MKPAPFAYHAPTTVDEVVELLGEHGDDGRVLAGGQSLVPLMALRMSRVEHLIDLNPVDELAGIDIGDGEMRIGAMTRQATIEHAPEVAAEVPLLARATPLIGHFQIRNRGTIGGSLAHADPAAEYPAVMLALDAVVEIGSRSGGRVADAADFFESMWTTSLAPEELLVAIRVPIRRAGDGFAIDEIARRHGDFAVVGSAVRVRLDSAQKVEEAAIAVFGMGPTALRAPAAESALIGTGADADLDEIARLAVADLDPTDDIHASRAYRTRVGAVSVRRALELATEEARSG